MGSVKKRSAPGYSEARVARIAALRGLQPHDICCICLDTIEVMAFRKSGVCCEQHRKDRDNDHSVNHAIIEAPQGGERV